MAFSTAFSPVSSTVTFDSVFPHSTLNTFTDKHGRTLLLRGLNVSGDAKFPVNNPLAGTAEFYDTSNISYTGRPFKNETESAKWWERLRSWGIGVVRLVVCWEALEPREIGVYDEEYITYVYMLVQKAYEAGLSVFIDGHQDVWSRFTGGSGAPLWTFHVAGLNPVTFYETCSAALDEPDTSSLLSTPSGRLWPTNYSKFAVATMFTLFFAGEVFAPKALYDGPVTEFYGMNIGHVLRTSYIRAYAHLMAKLKEFPNVLGVDPLNEPHPGFIGLPSLLHFNENTDLHLGHMPNALQSMSLAAGIPTSVPYFSRAWPHPSKCTRYDILNQDHISAWLPGRADIWQDERVFGISSDGSAVLGLKGASYFSHHPVTKENVDFERDFYVPFLRIFHKSISSSMTGGKAGNWLFVEPVPNLGPPKWSTPTAEPVKLVAEKICYSPHWYDIRVLYEKALWYDVSFDVLSLASGSRNFTQHTYFGASGLISNYAANFSRFWRHLITFRDTSTPSSTPVLIGETGVPWDMNRQCAYRTGNIHTQLVMTDAIFTAMERARLNWTFWNISLTHSNLGSHTAPLVDNQTSSAFQSGDGWNSEDFSIVSSHPAVTELPLNPYTDTGIRPHDNGTPLTRAALFGDLYRGLRGAPAVLRPYPFKTAGNLLHAEFNRKRCQFEMEYSVSGEKQVSGSDQLSRTTEIFVPAYHYWGRSRLGSSSVTLKFWVKPYSHPTVIREVEWDLRWDMQEGQWKGLGVDYWKWEMGKQSLVVVHERGLKKGDVIGITLEALENERVSLVGSLFGWFV